MSIIKRKKQDKFFQMSNHSTQENLTSLNSIGLLAYIISLPSDWTLYKTQLQTKFTRRTVDNAWAELVSKRYIAGFSAYVDRKKQYYYIASDEELNQSEYDVFVAETISEIKEKGSVPKNLQIIKDNAFKISDAHIVHHSPSHDHLSDVQSVQHSEYSTGSAVSDEQVQMKHNQDTLQINNNKDTNNVNNNDLYNKIIISLFNKNNDGLFTKKEWSYFSDKILGEMSYEPYDAYAYFEEIVKTIVHRRKLKLGLVEKKEPVLYNWLEN